MLRQLLTTGIRIVLQQLLESRRTGPNGAIGSNPAAALDLRESLFVRYSFTKEGAEFIRRRSAIQVEDFNSTRGGGYWDPNRNLVFLNTAQDEAALHEHAHVWWHFERQKPGKPEQMIEATVRLSEERDPRYRQTQKLAFDYVHGIPAQNWAGMLVERNDWEMFAGLASGTMGDMRLLPPYVRVLYKGLFDQPDE